MHISCFDVTFHSKECTTYIYRNDMCSALFTMEWSALHTYHIDMYIAHSLLWNGVLMLLLLLSLVVQMLILMRNNKFQYPSHGFSSLAWSGMTINTTRWPTGYVNNKTYSSKGCVNYLSIIAVVECVGSHLYILYSTQFKKITCACMWNFYVDISHYRLSSPHMQ